uniref:DNA-directed RNA polymerase subunit beta'' n=1 Tax=Scinaia undulata TaxID=1884664 RepID=A0A1G4NXI8_9FLOR|nr:RNA polymerase beta-subunit [Scinaia undulata]SCW23390.1 RNA polymerase beta-subunit [Scinaia undulata]
MQEKLASAQPSFSNKVIDKSQLKELIVWAFRNYGVARASNMADKLKDLGFYYATKAGISLSLEDLRIPPAKKKLLDTTMQSIALTDHRYYRGEITAVERFQKVIDTWNNASEALKKEVIQYFKDKDPLNSIYIMAFSGARGNISQVRQLVGMRGLMSDPQGQIIDLPISSNFREGLTVTDYFISSYGARKGLVDTALRTADSGYLTRRLVDVAQDVIIREVDCKTSRGILLEDMIDNQKPLIPLRQALLGRILADDIHNPVNNNLIAKENQEIDPVLAQEVINAGISKILVRSPITCDSASSVCQLCYGWNLAHGKLVDLGEAVGIIAAQSIGEPGTQLTMRTFHTGGVFTGELAQNIYAPIDGILEYQSLDTLNSIRTRHGDRAFLAEDETKVMLHNPHHSSELITINKGTILFQPDKARVVKGQAIAEYPLSGRLITERAQKSIVADFSGKVQFTNLTVEEIQGKQHTIRIVKQEGLAWILSSKTYRIPDTAEIKVTQNESICSGTVLATTKIVSQYHGYVELHPQSDTNEELENCDIRIIIASRGLPNAVVYFDNDLYNGSYILESSLQDKFLLHIEPDQIIVNQQIIAELVSDTYLTQTGGIVKYLDLPVAKTKSQDSEDKYDILGSGYILWISEETHEINKDSSLILVKDGDFVEAGTEIVNNVFAKNSGIIEIIHREGIVFEIIIKPGDIYIVDDTSVNTSKKRGFLRPGETIVQGITTNKLAYWEYIVTSDNNYLLIRPVVVYSIPSQEYYLADPKESKQDLTIKTVKRTQFKDGDRVKSVKGVNLVKTYLMLNIANNQNHLNCTAEFRTDPGIPRSYSLNFIIAESLSLKKDQNRDSSDIVDITSILVKNNQQVNPDTILAQTEIIAKTDGIIEHIDSLRQYNRRLSVITKLDQKIFNVSAESRKVKVNDWVYAGDEIANGVVALESGKITSIDESKIAMRIGRPYLVSGGTILHVDNGNLVQRGENIATLIFERPKTGDIVQGLPRIEEILEARKKSDDNFNPHILLESSFRSYLSIGLSLYNASLLSIQEIQLFLVKEVQLVYQSQGVDISDKHVEVIVRQMTSKVKIESGGDTECLPGEVMELRKIHAMNHTIAIMDKIEATYHPILLGITKASLNTESFISAASFQETTKVLTEAAISGKLDWLKGLKENVIIGRLIPAGTGFNAYNKYGYSESNMRLSNAEALKSYGAKEEYQESKPGIDDIILDDRSARDYHLS